jgi:AcrR family transcriptional regulator
MLLRGEQLSYSAVAAGAGVSRPTVYAHFQDRARLLEALARRAADRASDVLISASDDGVPPAEALTRLVRAGWSDLAHYREIARIASNDIPAVALRQMRLDIEAVLEGLIERGRAEQVFRSDLPAEWLLAASLALVQAAAAAVSDGRMDEASAGDVVAASVVDVCTGGKRPWVVSP